MTYRVGALLVEDTFTRDDGPIGSTEAGGLGVLAWNGDTSAISVSSGAALAASASGANLIWVDVASPNVRVQATVQMTAVSTFSGARAGIFGRGTPSLRGSNLLWRESVTGYRPRYELPSGTNLSYAGPSNRNRVLTIDMFLDEWLFGGPASAGPFTDAANNSATRVGIQWGSADSGDVFQWLDFHVWELLPAFAQQAILV